VTLQQPNADFLLCVSRGFIWRALLVAGILLLLIYVGDVLLIAFTGILLAILLRGLARLVQRLSFVSARWSYPLAICTLLILAVGAGFALGPRIITQAHEIAKGVPQSLASVQAQLEQYQWGHDINRVLTRAMREQKLAGYVGSYATTFVAAGATGIAILAIALFLGSKPGFYRRGLLQLVPESRRSQATELLKAIGNVAQQWLLGQLVPMSVLGIGTLVGLWALGVPLAFTLALLTALMLFIPYIGSILAYIPTVLIAFTQGPRQAIYVSALYLGVHLAEGYVITPLVQRRAVHLPPALTLICQLLMWKIAGVLGLLVATPLAAIGLVAVRKLYLERRAASIPASEV
jgi:predicted PurR-regulated permease PerM